MASRSIALRSSLSRELKAPFVFCLLMIAAAAVTCGIGHVSYAGLIRPYLESSLVATGLAAIASVSWWVVELARRGADKPLDIIFGRLRDRAALLFLAAVVIPIFYANYTGAKAAIPFTVGYTWDPFWTKADRFLLGADAWQVSLGLLPTGFERLCELLYTFVWAALLLLVPAFVSLNASRERASVFYTTLFAAWFIGGFVLAYAFSASGPVFTSVAYPGLDQHFMPLREMLQRRLIHHGPVQFTEAYLVSQFGNRNALVGAGISAMPSMHIAVVTIYVLMSRRTLWFVPACCFWIAIFVFSAFSGYHYWWDGIVSVAVTVSCWAFASSLHHSPMGRRGFI